MKHTVGLCLGGSSGTYDSHLSKQGLSLLNAPTGPGTVPRGSSETYEELWPGGSSEIYNGVDVGQPEGVLETHFAGILCHKDH